MNRESIPVHGKNDHPDCAARKTADRGWGLFANTALRRGAVITTWKDGKLFSVTRSINELPNEPPQYIRDHAIQVNNHMFMEANGIGELFNHACEPNCGVDPARSSEEPPVTAIVALRDIKPDEELTYDYATTEDLDWTMPELCRCGSPRCRKHIGPYSELSETWKKQLDGRISPYIARKYNRKKDEKSSV